MSEPRIPGEAAAEPTAMEPNSRIESEDGTVVDHALGKTTMRMAGNLARRTTHSGRGVVITLVLALIGLSVGAYAVASGSSGHELATAKNPASNVSGTSGAQAATVTAPAVPGPMPGAPTHRRSPAAASAANAQRTPKPLKPSDPAQVKSWNSGPAGAALAQVTAQAGTVLMTHAMKQYPQMLQACRALSGTVQTAQGLAPIPDAAMQQVYAESLTAFASGAAECMAGITRHPDGDEVVVTQLNQTDMLQAIKHFDLGMTDLYVTTEVLRNP